MRLIVFEDTAVTKLDPITTGRPAYAVTCGGYRLVDWLRKLGASLHGIVRPHLQSIQRLDYPDLAEDSSVPASPVSHGTASGSHGVDAAPHVRPSARRAAAVRHPVDSRYVPVDAHRTAVGRRTSFIVTFDWNPACLFPRSIARIVAGCRSNYSRPRRTPGRPRCSDTCGS